MDHKVSKDMISSGMIPSGEKTQADLSRTQYGSAPSPSKLMDAYKSMYEKKEEVINEHHKKDADGNTIPHEGEELNEFAITGGVLAAKGLMALKGAMAAAKATKLGTAALKSAAGFKKGLMTAKTVGGASKITTTGGKLASGANKISKSQQLGSGIRSAGASIKNNPTNTALIGTMAIPQGGGSTPQPANTIQQSKLGRRTAGMYNDVDLFDIVKGQLLDEGLNEKEVTDVMTTLTLEEINEVIQLNEVSASLLQRASISAGNKAMQLASKKDSAGAVKKLEQQKKFSGAMKQKNLAKGRVDNMRKPTGPMAIRPIPDYSKPYPGTPR